ncbi:alpha-D-ribose 1-methylphosphonate 5-triphosphate diphosphatase [Pseudoruegeria sp. SHC-113]|uniref:alpha-D-ribose 1-methylphosphonate 5-triphosphate diphosphatase n=1 Tax=Pseudoruegeria sp. SHC-113 TaxID=2855439 RepID=UPI0021BB4E4C|nr:alpha-D-ribose 1-methylphosphonate 5-triphosphate diphosphatase [Pseudoruegeria sp. SHC-113]MCT8162014.1 alpha-D-ribose 1-methylphosphonate 5-triphosphate diphosphatase [Pseudoruegeria sp. SHC-113]
MTRPLPPFRMTGATLLRDGALQQRSLAVQNGRLTRGPLPEVDLSGYLILPGIIDLHGDAFERHIAPRPTAPFPALPALRATDRDAAANGVTTAWMAQSWSWEGGLRGPAAAEALLAALEAYGPEAGTDLRVQVRCETHTVETFDRLLAALRRYGVGYVVFNNHLPEAEASDRHETPQAQLARLAAHRQRAEVPRYLCRLAEAFDTLGIIYGSHDDPDGETREAFSMIGAKICEFPTTRAAAGLAKAVGDPVLMGAPNVVRGGSQGGNIAAQTLIELGLCDALVSDYHYPSLAAAAFRLADQGLKSLPAAWAMISQTPAEIMGLHDRGVIEDGKRADLAIVNAETRVIEATLCEGRLTHLAGEAANRFLGASARMQMAAE